MSGATNESSPMKAVIAGERCIGHLLKRGREGVEAFDADTKSLGTFPTDKAAVAELLRALR